MLSKSEKTLSLEQNTKEVIDDISIVKLNFPNLQKAVITRFKWMETPKNRSFRDQLFNIWGGGWWEGRVQFPNWLDFGGSILKMLKMRGGSNYVKVVELYIIIMIEANPCNFLQK